MNVVLISTYELGRQPFGVASPAAWLKRRGASVACLDLSLQGFDEEPVLAADLIAIYLPMHTATRIAARVIEKVLTLNAEAHLCCYGLYAPVNEAYLRRLGAETILGGEFEQGLVDLYDQLVRGQPIAHQPSAISLAKQEFLVPDREGLPELAKYAHLRINEHEQRVVGYTEATRGCKHRCRHCPIVPVYNGRFRAVGRDVVLADIGQQVRAGAQHITFGDPDFFNGPTHALKIVTALHQKWPELTYDVTIKIEHLIKQARHLETLKKTGCLFVTSAVESIDAAVLEIYDKGHTREDFIAAVHLCREVGLTMNPTFVTFSPWTTLKNYLDLLDTLFELKLTDQVSPIQYAIRLLIPAGSRLLELPETRALIGPFDQEALVYPWRHPDPGMDALHEAVLKTVQESQAAQISRREIFARVWQLAHDAYRDSVLGNLKAPHFGERPPPEPVPQLSETWYC